MERSVEDQEPSQIGIRKITNLDRLVQILEISFIFLLIFSLIALVDTVLFEVDLYDPISESYLGEKGLGPLEGGNFAAILRITFIFNGLLFTFSLLFGLWMRKTRDNWEFSEMGFTLSTPGFSFRDLLRRGFFLGLIAIIIHFVAQIIVTWLTTDLSLVHSMVYFNHGTDQIYTSEQLYAHYYFGLFEMSLLWPLSAGFFFFAYAHSSLNSKFPTGIANVISTSFYVFYLQFFFLLPDQRKITSYWNVIKDPISNAGLQFWITTIAFWMILYISFSAFAETKSIVLPLLLNFVYNAGITIIQAGNATLFETYSNLMWLPLIVTSIAVISWYFIKQDDFSTIRIGISRLKDITDLHLMRFFGYLILFIFLSFFLPGLINEILFRSGLENNSDLPNWMVNLINTDWLVPLLYALNFIILILLATTVLTYEPTEVWDVLLINESGTPVASHIELFETDDVLISGFITALATVDQELSKDGGLSSIKRGEREILIEEGVFTRLIALADQDQPSIRQTIRNMHREFEIKYQDKIQKKGGEQFKEAKDFVDELGDLAITFNIPTQTRWISIISLAIAPLMITLIGLI